jgi:hypothetical protein
MKVAYGGLVLVAAIAMVSGVLLLHLRSTRWSPGAYEMGSYSTLPQRGQEHDGTVRVDGEWRTWKITVRAPREKLASATASVDGSDVHTATRDNGGIVDRDDDALATLVLPRTTWRWEGKVKWVGADGRGCGSERHLTGLARRLKPISDAAFRWLAR